MGFPPITRDFLQGVRLLRRKEKHMATDQVKHDKLKKLFCEVLLNYQVQEKWQKNVDPDFLECVDVMIKKYDQELPKEQWLRTGVMLGAVYEQWRQRNKAAGLE